MMLEECNWVQALEGDIDSSHIDFVHAKRSGESKQRGTFHHDKRPRLEVLPTDYGACYSARRRSDVEALYWHRITQFIMPFYSMIAASDPHIVSARAWVPLDDHHNLQFVMRARLDRPVTEEEARQVRDPFAAWGESVERHGEWLRRAEHPELPGCVAEAPSVVEALEALERERLRVLRRLWAGGGVIPVPRPPLRDFKASG
jgi:phenylpropionate dioxygenase-like ring-hydroxylating dioxygenase large terminal subunit